MEGDNAGSTLVVVKGGGLSFIFRREVSFTDFYVCHLAITMELFGGNPQEAKSRECPCPCRTLACLGGSLRSHGGSSRERGLSLEAVTPGNVGAEHSLCVVEWRIEWLRRAVG